MVCKGLQQWTIYGSELSPFTLKVMVMAEYVGLDYRLCPAELSTTEALKFEWRNFAVKRGWLPLFYPQKTADDEFPLVPFMFREDGANFYDSTAFGIWLTSEYELRPLLPKEAALRFLVRVIDEYADEFGLYMVHHNRWKVSAKTNDAGRRLAGEFPTGFAAFRPLISAYFSRRQVRRLPYLFSVADAGYHIPGLRRTRQPPSRQGFPPTHALLEQRFNKLLNALEPIFSKRDYLFGASPTLADFSLYGQLAMNLSDPDANRLIADTAPNTRRWLKAHYFKQTGELTESSSETKRCKKSWPSTGASFELNEDIRPLIDEICTVFIPLMQQNYRAVTRYKAQGAHRFNEAAYNRGECLYSGEICGTPFKHVALSFQARVWRDLVREYQGLSEEAKRKVASVWPAPQQLDRDFSYLPVNQQDARISIESPFSKHRHV